MMTPHVKWYGLTTESVLLLQPFAECIAPALRALQLDVECQPELGEKVVDLQRVAANHDAAHLLQALRLERVIRISLQLVDVSVQWQPDRLHLSAQQCTLDLNTGDDLGKH